MIVKFFKWLKHKIKTSGNKSNCSDWLFCDNCFALEPKEWAQTKKKETHICKVYKTDIKHSGLHPRLPTPSYCILTENEK